MTTTTEVRERPILFSGPMVRAILDGRKTQTRRVVKVPRACRAASSSPFYSADRWWVGTHARGGFWAVDIPTGPTFDPAGPSGFPCPYGAPGDRLWVRETWWHFYHHDSGEKAAYAADPGITTAPLFGWEVRKRPSIHMPRWASRLTLELTDVRVERLQDISHDDARAEGCEADCVHGEYRVLWDSLNAQRGFGWDVSPWVWVLAFRVA